MIDRSTRTRDSDKESESPASGLRNLDAARVDILLGLDAFTRVSDHFLEDVPLLFEEIRRALAAGDLSRAEKTAHRLKGSSANLGAMRLSSSFSRLEALARDGDPDPCTRLLVEAEAEYRAVEAELEEIRARSRDP